jgi:autotransporter-associated beta strand protein
VSVTGGSASEIVATTGSNNLISIGATAAAGATIFDVADVTGSAAPDLTVAVPLKNNRNNAGSAELASGLIKTGAGTMVLTSSNLYTGATTVSEGTLALAGTGSIDNSPAIAIADGATFDLTARSGGSYAYSGVISGNGTIAGQLTIGNGGRVAPGNSLGVLTVTGGPLTLASGATLEIELANPLAQGIIPTGTLFNADGTVNAAALTGGAVVGPPGLVNDRVVGDVAFQPGSTLRVLTLDGLTPTNLQKGLAWKIIEATTITGDFSLNLVGDKFTLNGGSWATSQGGINLNLPDLWGGSTEWGYYNWDLSLLSSDGILVLVPEPGRAVMLLLAGGVLLMRRRRAVRG